LYPYEKEHYLSELGKVKLEYAEHLSRLWEKETNKAKNKK
jgi:hypothetical protein